MTKTGTVTVNGAKLWYELGGSGDALVLIHAGIVDSRMWDDQWEAFTHHCRVIRFDQRGFGRSDPAQGPASRRADLLGLLDQLGIERAALLGCSLGGEAAIDLTLEHPERVSALIAVSATPGGFEFQGEPPRYLLEMFAAAQEGDFEKATELQTRVSVDGIYREPKQVSQAVRRRVIEMNRVPMERATMFVADGAPLDPLNPPAVTRLKEIGVPALIMAGALDHPEIQRAADLMAGEIAGAHKVIVPDSAHMLNMEKPQAFNQAVLDFLKGGA